MHLNIASFDFFMHKRQFANSSVHVYFTDLIALAELDTGLRI